ncbi:MAG: hypothetical protein EXQ70_11435 [Solirubrobacterales bacterium]|nr:hypothetical protein [Solirubrobacterales bacterium]
MTTQSLSQQIIDAVSSWGGIDAGVGSRGELGFKVGRRSIGHLHGDHAAHFTFPKRTWAELLEQGRIAPHPFFPDRQGLAARTIEDEDDIGDMIELLRLNYDRVVARHGLESA